MSILYVLLAKTDGREILVEHAQCEGNIRVVAREMLEDIKEKGFNSMKAGTMYLISYHMDEKIITLCMSQVQDTSLLSGFLSKVRAEFDLRHSSDESKKTLKKFESNLANLMKDFNTGNSKMSLVDQQISKLQQDVVQTQSRQYFDQKISSDEMKICSF